MKSRLATFLVVVCGSVAATIAAAEQEPPAWAEAYRRPPMTAEESRLFMKELAQFVFDNHLKKEAGSPQRGMVYEYLDIRGRASRTGLLRVKRSTRCTTGRGLPRRWSTRTVLPAIRFTSGS